MLNVLVDLILVIKKLRENGGIKCRYSNDDKKKYWVYSDGHKELCDEKLP